MSCDMELWLHSNNDGSYAGTIKCEREDGHVGWHITRVTDKGDATIKIGNTKYANSQALVKWEPIKLGDDVWE